MQKLHGAFDAWFYLNKVTSSLQHQSCQLVSKTVNTVSGRFEYRSVVPVRVRYHVVQHEYSICTVHSSLQLA